MYVAYSYSEMLLGMSDWITFNVLYGNSIESSWDLLFLLSKIKNDTEAEIQLTLKRFSKIQLTLRRFPNLSISSLILIT